MNPKTRDPFHDRIQFAFVLVSFIDLSKFCIVIFCIQYYYLDWQMVQIINHNTHLNDMQSTDHETGEVTLTKQFVQPFEIDMETGEMDSNIPISTVPLMRKTTFVVPKELYQTRRNKKKKLRCIDTVDNYTLFKKEEVINLHEVNSYLFTYQRSIAIEFELMGRNLCLAIAQEIILGCNKTSHRLFLIPTIFMCFRFYAVAMAFVEIFLHVWAHKKNARNTNEHIYYRSPLHIITSQFCASCLHKRQMDKVSKLQEKRQKIWHFKNMARF